ncbi:hypothetical protein [Burkholderia sp. MBR-1]|uniref:hypothetical protein n=1 Tax=Burkholderia sp. MBR-1 TaxID=2732364 RepID=UPI0028682596|nr:hypothetical protein [Burkholderia sp. MBR-1]
MPNDNVLTEPRDAIARSKRILALVDEYHENATSDTRTALRVALMDEFQPPTPDDARNEDAYIAKRLSEALADVYTTLVGDDTADADENLNAIERVERAAQVIRLEVELYRAQADARVGLTDEQRIIDMAAKHGIGPTSGLGFARDLIDGDKR